MRIAAVLAVLLASGVAHADGFTWIAPAECPTAGDVRERIDRRLGGGTVDDVEIDVIVIRGRHGFAARIDTRALTVAGQGRTLTAARCGELADAVAVVVARLASDAREAGVDRRPPAKPDTDVASATTVTPRSPRATRATDRIDDRIGREWNGGLRALALTGIGMTPHVGIGGDLAGFVSRGNHFVELGFARWVERPVQLFPGDNGTVEFGTQLFAVRGGWSSQRMPLRAWGGIETGTMHGVGAGLHARESRWVALAAGFGVGWPMSPRTRLVGTFEVAAALDRATFTFMDGTTISEPAPLSARSALGLEVAWR